MRGYFRSLAKRPGLIQPPNANNEAHVPGTMALYCPPPGCPDSVCAVPKLYYPSPAVAATTVDRGRKAQTQSWIIHKKLRCLKRSVCRGGGNMSTAGCDVLGRVGWRATWCKSGSLAPHKDRTSKRHTVVTRGQNMSHWGKRNVRRRHCPIAGQSPLQM